MSPELLKGLAAVHCVESVFEIQLKDNFGGVDRVSLTLLADGVNSAINS